MATWSDSTKYRNIDSYIKKKLAEEKRVHSDYKFLERRRAELIRQYENETEALDETEEAAVFARTVKEKLVKKYPDFFTEEKKGAFPVSFIYNGPIKNACESSAIMLSLLTLGLIPFKEQEICFFYIHSKLETGDDTFSFAVYNDKRANFGILGVFLPTYFLLPIVNDYDFQTTGVWADTELNLHISDRLLAAFALAVTEYDRNALIRRYNEKYTDEIKF